MKFDYCIGNPPYQNELIGTSDEPVYHDFMDAAYTIADKVELITPARFLFNAGKTPKDWNKKMLNDEHFKVIAYEADSTKVFPKPVDIKGGVAIHYHNVNENYGKIGVFASFVEMSSIYEKIKSDLNKHGNLSSIMMLQNKFDLQKVISDYPEYKTYTDNKGVVHERTEKRIVSSAFDTFKFFTDTKIADDDIHILGIQNLNRTYKWIPKKYITDNGNLNTYKVIVPNSNGSGAIGEVISTPLIGTPLIGYTQSFIGIGAFDTQNEAENALKYVKSKFCRVTLGLLKSTQSNSPDKWLYVPLQDFTSNSDIDWSQSIPDIDQQLYKKYGLSQEEITFIETHVKEMN